MAGFFHLSEMRKAVLNWYEFDPKADLLEIGAGYGALTGLFCEKCSSVSSLEVYPSHAAGIYERHRDKNNLKIYTGTIEEIQFERRFDYITMIGSLEFQGNGTSDPQVYAEYLKKVKSLLKPNGSCSLQLKTDTVSVIFAERQSRSQKSLLRGSTIIRTGPGHMPLIGRKSRIS
jgi:cyclopropane fatty-acyl-phospholipid synthase-like methyltransferase